jgi:hypothetical protein
MCDPIYFGLFLLMKAEATTRAGTPLAEIAVGAVVLLIPALFQTADKPMGCYLKAYPVFIDKLLFDVSHLLYITSYAGFGSIVLQEDSWQ